MLRSLTWKMIINKYFIKLCQLKFWKNKKWSLKHFSIIKYLNNLLLHSIQNILVVFFLLLLHFNDHKLFLLFLFPSLSIDEVLMANLGMLVMCDWEGVSKVLSILIIWHAELSYCYIWKCFKTCFSFYITIYIYLLYIFDIL